MGWMFAPVLHYAAEFGKSVAKYPNIPVGADDFEGYSQHHARQPVDRGRYITGTITG